MNNISFIMLTILFFQCSEDKTILELTSEEQIVLKKFKLLPPESQLKMIPNKEPGQKLLLCISFVSKTTNQTLPNQKVHIYQTNATGEYHPTDPNDESTARLNGEVITTGQGEVFVQTILPGDYGSSEDNRHIHTTVKNAKPEAYNIHFKQYISPMGKKFINGSDQHFLANLKMDSDSNLVTFLTIEVKNPQVDLLASGNQILPECEWCGANEAPADITWETTIADKNEKGDRLLLEGFIFKNDGKTPAENVIVYAYHTNAQGIYEKKGDETGNGLRHGHLRSWVKTDKKGRYRFNTIMPAPYPNHREPAHIHMTLKGEGFEEYWINATWFEGDKIITDEMISNLKRTGGFSNIVQLEKDTSGTLVGKRNIILNPPTG